MKNIKDLWRVYLSDTKTRLSFGLSLLAILGLFLIAGFHHEAPPPSTEQGPGGPDDFIPPGYSLLPLELQNREALTALVGGFAIVDLFTVSSDGKTKGVPVARRLKLVRSPQNPEYFAALVPEQEVSLLLAHPGPLVAAIQSRLGPEHSRMIQKSMTHSRIRVTPEEKK